MKDAMNIARQRRQDHVDAIAQLENEIEALHEKIGELDSFLDFGEALINGSLDEEDDETPEAPISASAPVRNTSELRSVLPVDDWHSAETDDGEDATEQSIARVLSARHG